MIPTFAIHVLHAPHLPGRVESLARLRAACGAFWVVVHDERAARHVFTLNRWRRALQLAEAEGDSHAVFLDDDVQVAPDFTARLAAMISTQPDQIIGLHTAHTGALEAHAAGEHWVTTDDGSIGTGIVFPVALLREFLTWLDSDALQPGTLEAAGAFGCDVLIGLFCMETGRRMFHPVPTVIDQDLSLLTSVPGNEDTPGRSTVCNWKSTQIPDTYGQTTPVRHLGRWFAGMSGIRQVHVRPRIFIACPTYGGIEPGFVESLIRLTHHLARSGVEHSFSFLSSESLITRARNRLAHQFLKTRNTHLLFLDCDLVFEPETIVRMVTSGFQLCGAPYPCKRLPSQLVCNLLMEDVGEGRGRIEMRGTFARAHEAPTGCLLIAREVFETLAPRVPEVRDDLIGGEHERMRVFFDCGIDGDRYLSEDWWFTRLWQMAGGEVWIDTQAKLRHVGKHAFECDSLAEGWANAAE